MGDTQWRRYQVFVQERAGEPHQEAGTVHAPDPEMALLNARDVFVRRPACASLWLVPVEAITVGNHRQHSSQSGQAEAPERMQAYHIFRKPPRPAASPSELGLVTARSPQEALELAADHFTSDEAGQASATVWWAFPAEAVIHSRPEDRESLFEPALDKPFRLSTDFKTHTLMRQLKDHSTEQDLE